MMDSSFVGVAGAVALLGGVVAFALPAPRGLRLLAPRAPIPRRFAATRHTPFTPVVPASRPAPASP